MTASRDVVLFVLKGYPRLSETFIAQEMRTLEKRGLAIRILALRRPTDTRIHPVHREIEAPVGYLPEYLHEEPARVGRGLLRAARLPGFGRALRAFLRDLVREPTRNRLRRFGQGCVMAAELAVDIRRIHAHFIHTPASAARYAALMTGLPFSISAHAKDIWTSPDWDLADKLGEAEWCVTCTEAGAARLKALAPAPDRVRLVYHGLDLARFPPMPTPRPARDGSDPGQPVEILTVARAVEKKGLDLVLAALATLPGGLNWRWTHVGGGGLVEALRAQARSLGIDARCDFLGALDQEAVLGLYRRSDLFVLPCRVAEDGDRDGLPNVLVEAASQGLALLSTSAAAVPEFVRDGVEGRLVPADDSSALGEAMARLISDPATRFRLARAALGRVRASFDHDSTVGALHALFLGESPDERAGEADRRTASAAE